MDTYEIDTVLWNVEWKISRIIKVNYIFEGFFSFFIEFIYNIRLYSIILIWWCIKSKERRSYVKTLKFSKFCVTIYLMLIHTDVTMAMKKSNGNYDIKDITLFDMLKMKDLENEFEVDSNRAKEAVIKVKCPVCGKKHEYKYNISDIISRNIIIGGCENFGVPILYVGKRKNILQRVNRYKQDNMDIFAMVWKLINYFIWLAERI